MKLTIEALYQQKSLHPVYLITGDEPFQQLTAQDSLRKLARQQGFEDRQVFDFSDGKPDWEALLQASQSMGLFSSLQLIELRLGGKRPDKSGNELLVHLLAQDNPDLLLIVSCSKLSKADSNAAWVKAIDSKGAITTIWPVDTNRLPAFTKHLLTQANLNAEPQALQSLIERSEGNLLALSQEIEKLSLLYPQATLTLEQIEQSVADSSHYSVFDLTDATSKGDTKRALRILDRLREEGEALTFILWNLTRDLQALEALSTGQAPGIYLPRPRLQALENQARKLGARRLQILLQLAFNADAQIKGQASGNPWDSLTTLTLALSGAPVPRVFVN